MINTTNFYKIPSSLGEETSPSAGSVLRSSMSLMLVQCLTAVVYSLGVEIV
jgi:hypothetical protein